ncbi:MAG: class I SAM-dependent methyltransferase [Bacteroidales bacterium]|nr:class I SAM-dependent methyltransferase [Bacteroidales bacterium]
MALSLFQLTNIVLVALLLFLAIRFLWMTLLHPPSQPAAWKEGVKRKVIPAPLVRLERFYPDKMRLYTWWLQVERLKKTGVSGAFAELGVYKGESARILHLMDPTRKFYLFDTFQGFPEADLEGETGVAATYTSQNFADTSISRVVRKINGNHLVEIVPGYFPGSAQAIADESYALVNIDVDLYKPTKAGLEYFYPRLTSGGIILVHDYNPKWPGVINAVDEFLDTISETPVLIPDRDGTLVVVKTV